MKISDIDIFVERRQMEYAEAVDDEVITIEVTGAERDMLLTLLANKRKEVNTILKQDNLRDGTASRVRRDREIVYTLMDKLGW